jgi:hypothetical protein
MFEIYCSNLYQFSILFTSFKNSIVFALETISLKKTAQDVELLYLNKIKQKKIFSNNFN